MKNAIRTIATVALAFALVGCSPTSTKTSGEDKTIKVGATAVPHAEILNNVVKDVLAKDGWTLEVTEFTDYVTPNTALEEGSLDANYFQTLGYMNDQNTSKTAKNAAVENAVRLFSDENRIVEVNSTSRPKPRKLKVRQYLVKLAFLSEKVYDKVTIRFYDVFFISNFKKRPDGKYEAVVSMSQKFMGEGDRPYSDVVQKNIQIILVPIQKPEGTYYEVKLGDISITDNNI